MATICDTTKKTIRDAEVNDELRQKRQDKFWEDNKELSKFLGYSKDDIMMVIDNLSKDDMSAPTEKEFNALLKNKGEKAIIATKIVGLMEGSELLTDLAKEIVFNHLPENQAIKFKKGQIDYTELNMSTLKNIYHKFLMHLESDDGTILGRGVYGNVVIPITPTKKIARKEKTGSLYTMTKAIKRFHNAIGRRTSDFINKPVTTKSNRDYGMGDVYNDVMSIENEMVWNNDTVREDLVSFWTRMMVGWVKYGKYVKKGKKEVFVELDKYDPNGQFYIHENWMPTGKKYESTGDAIYAFQNLTLLKDYTPLNEDKGAYFIDLPKKGISKMLLQKKKGRVVDDELLKYVKYHYPASVSKITSSLGKVLGIKPDQVLSLISTPDYKKTPVYLSLKDDKKDAIDALYSIFGDFIRIEPVIYGSTDIQYKQNHFPAMYGHGNKKFPFIWENTIQDLELSLEQIESELETAEGEDRDLLKAKQRDRVSAISRALFIRERMDEYPVDMANDVTMPLARDIKSLKNISNAIDIRHMRTDAAVYNKYVKHIMVGIETNELISKFIDSYFTAESDFARNYIINMFKIPFNRPDIEGNFLGLKMSTQGTLDKLGLTTPANVVQDRIRYISSWLTGTNLQGISTTLQNKLALHQNAINYGFGNIREAEKNYEAHEKEWGRMIAASGIIEFGDFFNDALVKEMGGLEFESHVVDQIHIAMMNFLKTKNENQFNKEISEILKGSKIWLENIHFDPLNEGVENYGDRIKKRQKILKRKRKVEFTNKLVGYAISMEWQANKNIKEWKYVPVKKYIYGGASYIRENIAFYRKKYKFTMSDTEKYIRSISFIMGIQRFQKNGYLPPGNPWEFSTEDYNRAIEVGNSRQDFTNFGLSTQDVGPGNWGDVGKLMGKFKFWSQQKMDLDMQIINDALRSYKKISDMKGNKGELWNWSSIYNVSKDMLTKGRNLKNVNPEAARLRRFLTVQGLLTILFDLFISPAAFIPGARGWFYATPVTRPLRGITSDILSLAMMPFTISIRMLASGLLFDEDEPEEEALGIFKYYMRRTTFGYAPIWSTESLLDGLYYLIMQENAGQAVGTALSPLSPNYDVQKKVSKAVDTMLDN